MRHRRGQTLLEVLIAIFIIAVGLMAVIGLAIGNAAAADQSADRVTATNLAREAIEIVKQKRDSNWLQGRNFAEGLADASGQAILNLTSNNPRAWQLMFGNYDLIGDDSVVSWLAEGRYYNQQGGGEPTKFHRLVELRALCRTDRGLNFAYELADNAACATGELIGLQVTVTVQWARPLGYSQVMLETRLFDWR